MTRIDYHSSILNMMMIAIMKMMKMMMMMIRMMMAIIESMSDRCDISNH